MSEKRIIVVDSQVLNSIQSCARKTKYSFIENIRPLTKAEPLERGDLLHKMLELWYGLKSKTFNWAGDTGKELADSNFSCGEELDSAKLLDFIIEAAHFFASKMSLDIQEVEETIFQMKEYCAHFYMEDWETLAVEESGIKELFDSEEIQILYSFKIDRVAQKGNVIAAWDHKSSKRRQDPSSLSNQFMGYAYGIDTPYVIVNKIGFQKTVPRKDRFQRDMLRYDKEQINEWKENSIYWIMHLLRCYDKDFWPMNLTSCDKYSGCIYKDNICERTPDSRERNKERFFKIDEVWDVTKHLGKS